MNTLAIALALADNWHNGPWDGPPFPFFLIPLAWLLILGTIAFFVIRGWRHRDQSAGPRAGERVLAERFAAGEIDEEEYRLRLAVLHERK